MSVVFSSITMTSNQTVPTHQRASMNGLSMLGGSLVKGFGPIFAGILFSTSVAHIAPPFGSVFVYCVIAALGLCSATCAFFLKEADHHPHNGETSSKVKACTKNGEKKEDAPLTF